MAPHAEAASNAGHARCRPRVVFDIGHVENEPLADHGGQQLGTGHGQRVDVLELFEYLLAEVVIGDVMDQLAVGLEEPAEETITQADRAPHDRIEDGLNIRR